MNSINNKSAPVTLDPGASGDSFTQFDINTSNKFRIGIDDSDSDQFKISVGNALGTTDTHKIQSDGTNMNPLQPSFLVTGGTANATGDGTLFQPVVMGTSIFDIGSNYNTGTYYFTSPVNGYYLFTYEQSIGSFDSSHTKMQVIVSTTTRDYYLLDCNPYAIYQPTHNVLRGSYGSILAYMNASDTACVGVIVYGTAKTVGVTMNFNGYLVL